jgi:hypothetical protein
VGGYLAAAVVQSCCYAVAVGCSVGSRHFAAVAVVLLLISTVVAVDVFYMKVDVLIVQVLTRIQTFIAIQGF